MPTCATYENVPLKDDIDAYFECDVHPHVPDAWMDRTKDKVGYEINFNRLFLQVHASAPTGGDRRGVEASGGGDHALAAGGDGVSAALPEQWTDQAASDNLGRFEVLLTTDACG